MLINSSDSFSRFLALYKFVCMYDDVDEYDDDMGLTDEGLCYSVQSGLWQAECPQQLHAYRHGCQCQYLVVRSGFRSSRPLSSLHFPHLPI